MFVATEKTLKRRITTKNPLPPPPPPPIGVLIKFDHFKNENNNKKIKKIKLIKYMQLISIFSQNHMQFDKI